VRHGVRVGVDAGSVRVGVAVSDPDGLVATPLTVLRRDVRGRRDLDQIAELVAERGAVEVLVGLPRTLAGSDGVAAVAARGYAGELAARVTPVDVRLVDERLTTVEAHRGLRSAGMSSRSARTAVDASAAALILQHGLDIERATGQPPGERAR
jgi:putative holliday junction resolvase